MATESNSGHKPGTPGRVMFLDGRGEMPMLEITTAWSTAEIYLFGAHVTNFRKRGEAPILFLSQCSRFDGQNPIRGGVPIIFPWFGPREGMPAHGFARTKIWELKEVTTAADGSVSVRLRLPDAPESAAYPPFLVEYVVTVNEHLAMEFIVTNESKDTSLEFEECLHTYFMVEDIAATSVVGLNGVSYSDRAGGGNTQRVEGQESIRVSAEVDRIYVDTKDTVEIHDARLGRIIRVAKENSASTVVWNPWIKKSQQMPDFGNEEYQKMICVESGNVGPNKIVLAPGKTSRFKVTLSSAPEN